jgi:outer membrane protein assembly factor BamB
MEAMMRRTQADNLVYIGIKGTVLALDRRTGVEQWRTPLKGAYFVNVALDGDVLLATSRGEIFGLDPLTGRIRWHNPLKGMGWGLITIAGTSIGPMAQHMYDQQAAASASGAAAAS